MAFIFQKQKMNLRILFAKHGKTLLLQKFRDELDNLVKEIC